MNPVTSPHRVRTGVELGSRPDERAARRDLRAQIARLERGLGRLHGDVFPRQGLDVRARIATAQPGRVLGLDDLERVRDSMVDALAAGRARLEERRALEGSYRELIREMETNPADHKWERISNFDIGEPGCKHWHSRPRWGILGALMGWWRVKVSSGCPLAKPPPGGRSVSSGRFAAWQARGNAERSGVPGPYLP